MLAGKAVAIALLSGRLGAQNAAPQQLLAVPAIGEHADDRTRIAQLTGADSAMSYLLRSVSTQLAHAKRDGLWHVDYLLPSVRWAYNSALPQSANDGALWSGRGISSTTRFGFAVEVGPVRLVFAPEYVTSQNLEFQAIPFRELTQRSRWANPWHAPPESIDLPLRFGDQATRAFVGGQSSLTIDFGRFTVGAGTENVWWGPGVRNALVLSNNADGFPHLFFRAREPVNTRAGTFNAQWLLGRLDESPFFDHDSTNNVRALSGVAFTWQPRGASNVQLGFSRIVMTPVVSGAISLGTALNAFHSVGRPNTAPKHPTNLTAPDQYFSLFGRWIVPSAGFESYFEWARSEEPAGLRDLLEQPAHSQGYTLGLQSVRPVERLRGSVRIQAEATYIEPSSSLRFRPLLTSYTSESVPQGFTQRGQMLGPAIGPGSSSQWIAVDVLRPTADLGFFVGRIRWDNGKLFQSIVPPVKDSDLSLFTGLRGSMVYRGVRVSAEYTRTLRLNYLFQAYLVDPTSGENAGIDLANHALSIMISPVRNK